MAESVLVEDEQDGVNDANPPTKRGRGRPRANIDSDAVADAVAELFEEGGEEKVTIPEAADKLSVSRATLYRTYQSREELMGVLFERSTRALTKDAEAIVAAETDPLRQLTELIRLQVRAAIDMRGYISVFFGGGDLPADVYSRWHHFSRKYELIWVGAVDDAMNAGILQHSDPVITARLLLGQCIWVSRWYRPNRPYDADQISGAALKLLGVATAGVSNPPVDA